MLKKIIYLDYAAATPTDKKVVKAMEPYFSEKFYNPSATYMSARAIKDEIAEAKKSIAGNLGAKHSEIIHTSGGTESNNLAISGVMDLFPGKKVLVPSVEHESVLNPAGKYKNKLIPVNKQGIIGLNSLENMISNDVVLVSIMLANNETGSLQPIKDVAEMIREVRKSRLKRGVGLPLYLHTDACQAPCYLDTNVNRLGVDFMTLNGGKIYGPKQSGILFVRTGIELKPQMLGGGHQRGFRSGTENPAAVVGFAKALEIAAKKRKTEIPRIGKLRGKFIEGLAKINPDIIVNGSPRKHLPHILNVTFPGADNERLLFQLEDNGILAASGSACSASSAEPSHVLSAMGLSDKDVRGSIRFSFGRGNDEKDIDDTLNILSSILA